MSLEVLQHPVANHCLNQLRRRETPPDQFRRYCHQVTTFLGMEATRDLGMSEVSLETPMERMGARQLAEPVVVVAILRAGAGMVDSLTRLLPEVSVGYVGLERDEETAQARCYYAKFPPMEGRRVLVVDPMLATGGSAEQALEQVIAAGATAPVFICMVAAPEGVRHLEERFPGLRIVAGAMDRKLDENAYILPGLGDFGDRLYGT